MTPNPAPRWPAYLLVTVGLGLSAYLEAVHVQTFLMPGKEAVCTLSAELDCGKVAMSRFAVLGGVPLPIWGLASFFAFGIAAHARSRLVLPLAAIGVLGSLALFVEAMLNVGSICLLCEGVHLAWLGLFAWAVLVRKRLDDHAPPGLVGPRRPSKLDILTVFALPALLLLLALVFVPRYWELSTWTDGVPYPHGVDEDGRPWVGAENPKVVVHEYTDYGCIHCSVGTAKMRARLADDPDAIRIVRHQMTRMDCKPSTGGCTHARAAICAGEQGKFWEMDGWLFLHAPGRKRLLDYDIGARELGLDLDAFHACYEREDVYEKANRDYKDALKSKIRETPGYIIDGKRIAVTEIFDAIDDRL